MQTGAVRNTDRFGCNGHKSFHQHMKFYFDSKLHVTNKLEHDKLFVFYCCVFLEGKTLRLRGATTENDRLPLSVS